MSRLTSWLLSSHVGASGLGQKLLQRAGFHDTAIIRWRVPVHPNSTRQPATRLRSGFQQQQQKQQQGRAIPVPGKQLHRCWELQQHRLSPWLSPASPPLTSSSAAAAGQGIQAASRLSSSYYARYFRQWAGGRAFTTTGSSSSSTARAFYQQSSSHPQLGLLVHRFPSCWHSSSGSRRALHGPLVSGRTKHITCRGIQIGSISTSSRRSNLLMVQKLCSCTFTTNISSSISSGLVSRTWARLLRPQATAAAKAVSAATVSHQLQLLRYATTSAFSSCDSAAAAAAAVAHCWEVWMLWAMEHCWRVGSALLNAVTIVSPHLPMALGLLTADMISQAWLTSASAQAVQWEVVVPEDPSAAASAAAAEQKCKKSPSIWSPACWAMRFDEAAAALSTGARLVWLVVLFLPLLVATPLALQFEILPRQWWLVLLRGSLEAAGPAFIKWGQWAATRHDLFPPDVCASLEKLHTSAPAHSAHYTTNAIKRAFGLPAGDLFEWLEPTPLASGSIGQIHRARLSRQGAVLTGCQEGALVAVKVRHPGVDVQIERDFKTMVWLSHIAGELFPAAKELRLEDTLKQFAAPLHEQVDLSREARNLFKFNHNFRRTRNVTFPTPHYPLVAPDVLVESFEAGRHISSYIAAGQRHPYSHRLAELGSGTMLQMMLVDNLIHSDLHPGNILVRLEVPRGLLGLAYKGVNALTGSASFPLTPALRAKLHALQAAWLQPRIVLLDVGMATELSGEDQSNMLGLFKCFAALDGRGAGNWILRFCGREQSCTGACEEAFLSELERTFDELRKTQTAGWDNSHFDSGADALASVLELVRIYGVSLPGHICAVVVTTLILEGWSNQLDPTHSVLTQVQGMFEPQNFSWQQRINHVVDNVMDREDTAFAMA